MSPGEAASATCSLSSIRCFRQRWRDEERTEHCERSDRSSWNVELVGERNAEHEAIALAGVLGVSLDWIADLVPAGNVQQGVSADVRWAADEMQLTGHECDKLVVVDDVVGGMSRAELLLIAGRIVANRR